MDLALFDFDGTITDRETMPDFLHAAVPRRRLLPGKLLLLPIVLGYRAGLVSGTRIRAAVCFFGFSGACLHETQAHGRRFAMQFLPKTLRPEAMARIAWHKSRGDTVVVVSGGLDLYLRPWCEAHGLHLLCSSLQHRAGRLTGRYLGNQCVLAEKARLVRAHFPPSAYRRIFAYGDTEEDRDLLALAHEPYYRGRLMPPRPTIAKNGM